MKIRGKGIAYLDSIDLEILNFLDSPNYKINGPGWLVLDIVSKLGIKHNNLKPHLDKLLTLKLISTIDLTPWDNKTKDWSTKKKIGLVSIRALNNNWFENESYDPKDKEYQEMYTQAEQENKYYMGIIKLLTDIQKYFYDKEKEKYIEIDLRTLDAQERLLDKRKIINRNSKKITPKK